MNTVLLGLVIFFGTCGFLTVTICVVSAILVPIYFLYVCAYLYLYRDELWDELVNKNATP